LLHVSNHSAPGAHEGGRASMGHGVCEVIPATAAKAEADVKRGLEA
jgi:hypothetical protein